jgi:mRNA interferase RelE/StbE
VAKKEICEVVLTKPAEKTYDRAPGNVRQRLGHCFEGLEINPLYGNNVKPLTGKLKGLYRYRVGDWRVIYRLFKEKMVVEIIAILPRGNAYKK